MSDEIINRDTMDAVSLVAGIGMGTATTNFIGTAVGSTGLLGSIGSALGYTVAASTPVGWLVGGAILGGGLLYGASKVVGAKGESDGDAKAYLQFNSDMEKKEYYKIITKLSHKSSQLAYELLNKLPSDYDNWKIEATDGLEKGTMHPEEIISVCCEVLKEDKNLYLKKCTYSYIEIGLALKVFYLIAISDSELLAIEKDLIEREIINFFELESILEKQEIELFIAQSFGSEQQLKELQDMSNHELQTLLTVFFLTINNEKIKTMMIGLIDDIIKVDGRIHKKEVKLFNIYKGLLQSELNLEHYFPFLEQLAGVKSRHLYSVLGENPKKFVEKIPHALASYAQGIPSNMVVSLYDDTIFGKADSGFIVTSLAIITDLSIEERVIPLEMIKGMKIEDNKIILYSRQDKNDNISSSISLRTVDPTKYLSEFISFLEGIINFNNKRL